MNLFMAVVLRRTEVHSVLCLCAVMLCWPGAFRGISWFCCRKDWVGTHSDRGGLGTTSSLCIKEPERSWDSSPGSHKPPVVLKTTLWPWLNTRVILRGGLGSAWDQITSSSTEPFGATFGGIYPGWKWKPRGEDAGVVLPLLLFSYPQWGAGRCPRPV